MLPVESSGNSVLFTYFEVYASPLHLVEQNR